LIQLNILFFARAFLQYPASTTSSSCHQLIVETPFLYQVPFNKLLLLIPKINLRRQINSLLRPRPSLVTSSPYFHHWLANFHTEYSTTAQSTFLRTQGETSTSSVGNCNCMASTGVNSFTSSLDHWILSLESEKLSFQSQVQQLDLAISELNSNHPNSPAIQHIQLVRGSLVRQLSSVLQEISDLNLVKLLVSTQPSIRNYEHLIRLSHRQNRLRHSAEYYQDLSTLFDSLYKYLYQR